MVGNLESISVALARRAEPEAAAEPGAAAAPSPAAAAAATAAAAPAAAPSSPAGLALQLTAEQWASLSAQWEQLGGAATELTLAVGPQSVGSLRIACGWVSEHPWPFRAPGAVPAS
ncbi:hypothetical protein ABT095_25060 [Kitasatospora sp. NPDC002227]|uniref:hypothetical protein n=1 Tax=Kitasatospora sp. NPDC002227 TaxID=3154773 RepID=UPI00332000D8